MAYSPQQIFHKSLKPDRYLSWLYLQDHPLGFYLFGFYFPFAKIPLFCGGIGVFPNYSTIPVLGIREVTPFLISPTRSVPIASALFRLWEFLRTFFSVIIESASRSTSWSIFATVFGSNLPHIPNFRPPLPNLNMEVNPSDLRSYILL